MRILILILAASSLFSGCARMKAWLPSRPKQNKAATVSPVVVAISSGSGKVAKVNQNARYVVLTFLPGEVPALDRRLNVYRDGLKVAEVKVTGPQRDNNTVANIVAGEPQPNDDARPD